MRESSKKSQIFLVYHKPESMLVTLEAGVPAPTCTLTLHVNLRFEKLVGVKLDTEADSENSSILDGRTKVKVSSSCDIDSGAIISLQGTK